MVKLIKKYNLKYRFKKQIFQKYNIANYFELW